MRYFVTVHTNPHTHKQTRGKTLSLHLCPRLRCEAIIINGLSAHVNGLSFADGHSWLFEQMFVGLQMLRQMN